MERMGKLNVIASGWNQCFGTNWFYGIVLSQAVSALPLDEQWLTFRLTFGLTSSSANSDLRSWRQA